jgi:hypothetical protein
MVIKKEESHKGHAPEIGAGEFSMRNPKIKGHPLRYRKMHQSCHLLRESHETTFTWFTNSGITIGEMATTPARGSESRNYVTLINHHACIYFGLMKYSKAAKISALREREYQYRL